MCARLPASDAGCCHVGARPRRRFRGHPEAIQDRPRLGARSLRCCNAAVTVLGEYTYLVPLNHGRNAYVRNLLIGRTPNLRTDSDAFVDEIRALALLVTAPGCAPRSRR